MHAIVSIHDVMPATMQHVTDIIERIQPSQQRQLCLLVVPGLEWSTQQIDQLHQWQGDGIELAGHGWRHQTSTITSLKHKLHSRFISRDVAEHLSINTAQIMALLHRNFAWWQQNDFQPPTFYVPPAWAMGKISLRELSNSPFRYFEDSGGLLNAQTGHYRRLPLLGFEADTLVRQTFLTAWNTLNQRIGSASRPVRVSIHPFDFELRIGRKIDPILHKISHWHTVDSIFTNNS